MGVNEMENSDVRESVPAASGKQSVRKLRWKWGLGIFLVGIGAIFFVELRQVKLLDSIKNKPRQMILRQPVSQRWRQQIRLISVARQEIVSHIISL